MAGKMKYGKVWTTVYIVVLALVIIAAAGLLAYFLQGGTGNSHPSA